MHWLIKCRSKPNTDDLRLATIDAHRRFLDGYPDVTWYSGPIFTDDNQNAIGSLRLIEFPDRTAAETYIHSDPYTKAGLFEAITVQRWKPALDVRQRDYPRKKDTMQFVIHCLDKPDGGALRAPLEDAHSEYMKAHRGIIVARGALLDDSGAKSIGAVAILDVTGKAEAEAFWAGAPFNRGGVYERTTIERWRFGHV